MTSVKSPFFLTKKISQLERGGCLRGRASYDVHGVFCQGQRSDSAGTLSAMKVFIKLAEEIVRKIDSNEIDPRNELLGVKLGTYRQKLGEENSQRKWPCCWFSSEFWPTVLYSYTVLDIKANRWNQSLLFFLHLPLPLHQGLQIPQKVVLLFDLVDGEAEEGVGLLWEDRVDEVFYLEVLEVNLVDVLYLLFWVAQVLEAGQTALVVLVLQEDHFSVAQDQHLVVFILVPVALIVDADQLVFWKTLGP